MPFHFVDMGVLADRSLPVEIPGHVPAPVEQSVGRLKMLERVTRRVFSGTAVLVVPRQGRQPVQESQQRLLAGEVA